MTALTGAGRALIDALRRQRRARGRRPGRWPAPIVLEGLEGPRRVPVEVLDLSRTAQARSPGATHTAVGR